MGWGGETVATTSMPSELDADAVTLDDLDAAMGRAPLPAEASTGVIYDSDEQFLAHLADEPVDLPAE